MSDELEERLMRESTRFPAPSVESTADARRAVLDAGRRLVPNQPVSMRERWRSKRWATLGAIVAFAAVAAFGSGYAVASRSTEDGVGAQPAILADAGPGFLPAEGWDTLHTGLTGSRQAPAAIAATIPLDPEDLSQGAGNLPSVTIASLPADGILLFAIFYPRGEIAAVDENFPERSLPVSLADADEGSIEGDPRPENASFRLLAGVNGWNADIIVFTGAERATKELERRAQEELARLVIPQRPSA